MGYFSWDCRKCNKSLKSPDADVPMSQIEGVAILPNGIVLVGRYDGYGNLCDSGEQFPMGDAPDVYHRECWLAEDKPIEYKGGSEPADDQGFFGFEPQDEDEYEECRECGCELDPDWDIEDICDDCAEAEEAEDGDWCDGCDMPGPDCECDLIE